MADPLSGRGSSQLNTLRATGSPQASTVRAGGPSPTRIALALGSGGARGYAHIGVINELRGRGYQIVGIAGSSMGALVGGLHAAGKLDEFTDWAKSLTQRAILRLLDPSITAAGVLRAEKILDAVHDILGTVTIERLPIPYTAVATDLLAGKSVWLQRGRVDEAIRASIAIPGVIAPYAADGRLLADGGILDPLPMAPIAAANSVHDDYGDDSGLHGEELRLGMGALVHDDGRGMGRGRGRRQRITNRKDDASPPICAGQKVEEVYRVKSAFMWMNQLPQPVLALLNPANPTCQSVLARMS